MQRRALVIGMVIVIALSAFIFVSTLQESFWYSRDTEVPVPFGDIIVREVSPGDRPSRLKIPALQIDTYIQEVGVNGAGNMAAPSNFTDVGWYKHGTVPGFIGSAVVTGHVDNALSLPGIFKHLNALKPGDDVYIEKQDGSELHFRVAETLTYPYANVPLKTLFSRSDMSRLNLITCGGTWLSHMKMYDERLVVYTELVSEQAGE